MDGTDNNTKGSSGVNSVVRAFNVLEYIALQGEARISDIGSATGLDVSTVHRLLATLKKIGYVQQMPASRKYTLSSRLAWFIRPDFQLREQAHPLLAALASETGETVNLGILDGTDVLYVDTVEGANTLSTRLLVGQKLPAYCSAMGKAILSCLPFDKVQELFHGVVFRQYTKFTLKNLDELLGDLETTRTRGYAFDRMEAHEGLSCVGAPLLSLEGRMLGGISISCLSSRCLSDGTVSEGLTLKLVVTARKISSILGRNS